jgi:hypothetical protein
VQVAVALEVQPQMVLLLYQIQAVVVVALV